MRFGKTTWVLCGVCLVVLALFDISFQFEFAMPRETEISDPDVEAEYARCYKARDDDIHTTAFGSIDKPDVQKEFISSNRARAVRECRAMHPETIITIGEPFHFKLVDLKPRFW